MKHFPIYHPWILIFKLLCKVVFPPPVSQGKWGSMRSLFAPRSHSSPLLCLLSLRSFQSLRDLFMHACELCPFRHVRLCVPMDCSPPGSSVPGILQARILEWAAISSPGDPPNPGTELTSPALAGGFFTLSPPERPRFTYKEVWMMGSFFTRSLQESWPLWKEV